MTLHRTGGRMALSAIAAFSAFLAVAAPVPIAPRVASVPINHVSADAPRIHPAARGMRHIEIVNVGGAIPEAVWPEVVAYAASRLQVTIWTNALAKSVLGDLVSGRRGVRRSGSVHGERGGIPDGEPGG